ncbi:MAG: hypothetical protein AAFX94_16285, partial [Myxococcota bacterium]
MLSLLTVSGLFAVAGAVARLFAQSSVAKLFAGTVLIGAVLQAPSVIEPACAVLVLFVYPRLRTFALGAGLSAILFADRPVLLVSALAVLTYGDGQRRNEDQSPTSLDGLSPGAKAQGRSPNPSTGAPCFRTGGAHLRRWPRGAFRSR